MQMKELDVPRLYRSMSDYNTFQYLEPDRERIIRAGLRDIITQGKINSIHALIEYICEGFKKYPNRYGITCSDGRTYRMGYSIIGKTIHMSEKDYDFFMRGRIDMDFDYVIQVIREVKLKNLNIRVAKAKNKSLKQKLYDSRREE